MVVVVVTVGEHEPMKANQQLKAWE